jgi:hypothetical protein
MSIKEWWLAQRQQDEREWLYAGRAGLWAFTVTALISVVMQFVYMFQGQYASANTVGIPVGFGLVVLLGLLIRWKITR